jgi:hypothetical protein
MMRNLFARFEVWFDRLLQSTFNRTVSIQATWDDRSTRATRRLLTVRETRDLLRGIGKINEECPVDSAETAVTRQCAAKELNDDAPLGDCKDVHILVEPALLIGAAIEECDDHFALATVETRKSVITALCFRGRVIAADSIFVLRNERRGPIRAG